MRARTNKALRRRELRAAGQTCAQRRGRELLTRQTEVWDLVPKRPAPSEWRSFPPPEPPGCPPSDVPTSPPDTPPPSHPTPPSPRDMQHPPPNCATWSPVALSPQLCSVTVPALTGHHGLPEALAGVALPHNLGPRRSWCGLYSRPKSPGGTVRFPHTQARASRVCRPLLNRHWSPLALGPRCLPGAPSWQRPGCRSCQSHRRSPTLWEESEKWQQDPQKSPDPPES